MNPFTELAPMLKTLRLSGMLDSLETRNRQALTEQLAPTEFLTLLLQDELARRDQHKFARRLHRAAFHSAKTIEQFDFAVMPGLNRALVHDLLTCRFVAQAAPIHIVGPVGTGKSHLAQAIGHQAVRQGHDVHFATQSQLLGALHRSRLSGVYERRIADAQRACHRKSTSSHRSSRSSPARQPVSSSTCRYAATAGEQLAHLGEPRGQLLALERVVLRLRPAQLLAHSAPFAGVGLHDAAIVGMLGAPVHERAQHGGIRAPRTPAACASRGSPNPRQPARRVRRAGD